MQLEDAELADLIAEAVKAAVAPWVARVETLERRAVVNGIDGAPGPKGDPGPCGEKGECGLIGPQGDRGERGEIGAVGPTGPVGPVGAKGDRGDVGPAGLDGGMGPRGDVGPVGPQGQDGLNGKDGADAVGIADAIVDNEGALVLTFTDGRTKAVGKVQGKSGRDGMPGVPGRPGEDGQNGEDGLGLDDLVADYDGERTVTLKAIRGERIKVVGTLILPMTIDRGVWKEGQSYERGDCVSWGGSLFIAQRSTTAKPETNGDWRLAVKRGRDGKGLVGPMGPQGPKGDKGDR